MGFILLNPQIAFSNGPEKRSGKFCIENLIDNYTQSLNLEHNLLTEELVQKKFNFVDGLTGLGGISGIENKDKDGGEINFKPLNQDRETCTNLISKEKKLNEDFLYLPEYLKNNCKKSRQLFLQNRILII